MKETTVDDVLAWIACATTLEMARVRAAIETEHARRLQLNAQERKELTQFGNKRSVRAPKGARKQSRAAEEAHSAD